MLRIPPVDTRTVFKYKGRRMPLVTRNKSISARVLLDTGIATAPIALDLAHRQHRQDHSDRPIAFHQDR